MIPSYQNLNNKDSLLLTCVSSYQVPEVRTWLGSDFVRLPLRLILQQHHPDLSGDPNAVNGKQKSEDKHHLKYDEV